MNPRKITGSASVAGTASQMPTIQTSVSVVSLIKNAKKIAIKEEMLVRR